jgi:hypothetical protein
MTKKVDQDSNRERILPLPPLPPEIKAAVNQNELVIFIGAGVSRIIGCKSWSELANELVEACFDKGCINFKEKETLRKEMNQKKKISICQHILAEKREEKLFHDIIDKSLQSDKAKTDNFPIYKELHKLRAIYVTTNVDKCFDDLYFKDLIIYRPQDFEQGKIDREHLYHLHGTINDPTSLILTVRNYLTLYSNSNVRTFLEKLFTDYSVMFVGYGMDEFEVLDFLLTKANSTKKERKHFILLPMFRGEENILTFEESYYGDLGITVVPYAIDDRGYEQLHYVVESFEKEINLASTFIHDSFEKIEKNINHYDSENAKHILQLIKNDRPLEDHFFKKLTSAEWLLPLKDAGYFDPSKNPKPQPTERAGFYTVPYWNVLNYLEKMSEQNAENGDPKHAETLMEIVRSISKYREEGKSVENYRTNAVLIRMMSNVSPLSVKIEDIEITRQFLESEWNTILVAVAICENLFSKLLKNREKEKVLKLLEIVISVKWTKKSYGDDIEPLMGEYWFNKLLEKNKIELANLFPLDSAKIIINKIDEIVTRRKIEFTGNWISLFQDTQNPLVDTFQNLLVQFTRDLLSSAIRKDATVTKDFLSVLLTKDHSIFKRLSLSIIDENWDICSDLFFAFAKKRILTEYNIRNEVYSLLKAHYSSFPDETKNTVLKWIEEGPDRKRKEESEEEFLKTICFWKQHWLSALLPSNDKKIIEIYEKCKEITHAEHEEYEVVNYPVVIRSEAISPIEVQDILQKTNDDLAQYLKSYKEIKSSWNTPSVEGLGSALRKAVNSTPDKFDSDLKPFADVPFIYQYEIVHGFSDAWKEKKEIKWDCVLGYCKMLISKEEFWKKHEETEFQRNWLVSQIADLIVEGTREDVHAYPPENLPITEEIVLEMLEKTETDIRYQDDLLTATLNSAKGRVIRALFEYTLRVARLKREKDGSVRWGETIKKEFTKRLDRNIEPSLEWSLSLGEYLPNLYSLDKDWVKDNIDKIFLKENKTHWMAAMEGYLALPQVFAPLYDLVKAHGHYQEAIASDVKKDTRERLVDHFCIGYLRGEESISDEKSLFRQCLNYWKLDDILNMISFFWMQREHLVDKNSINQNSEKSKKAHKEKIIEFCSYVYGNLKGKNTYSTDEKRILSQLCLLSCFIDKIDEATLLWLNLAARFTDDINNIFFIEYLDRLCDISPQEVGVIFFSLSDHLVTYTKEGPIRSIVTKLYSKGEQDFADKICNTFFGKGLEFIRDIYEANKQTS